VDAGQIIDDSEAGPLAEMADHVEPQQFFLMGSICTPIQ
jgi:hypothetical protein